MRLYVHYILLIFIAISFFYLSACATIYRYEKKKLNTNYLEGIQYYKKRNYKVAKERFETVLSIDPEHSGAKQYLAITTEALQKRAKKYYDAGMSYKKKGNFENALLQFLEAQKRDPNYKDVNDQIENIRKSSYGTKKFDYYYFLAKKQFQKKQYIVAYKSCNKAQIYNPESLELNALKMRIKVQLDTSSYPYTSKAERAKKKRDYKLARKICNKALAVNPWDEKAQSIAKEIDRIDNLNELYKTAEKAYTKGDLFTAYRLFQRIDDEEPGYRNSKNYLATIKTRLEAKINRYYQNGIAYYEEDNFKAAIAEWDKVLLINPNHQEAREYRGRAVAKLELQKSLR